MGKSNYNCIYSYKHKTIDYSPYFFSIFLLTSDKVVLIPRYKVVQIEKWSIVTISQEMVWCMQFENVDKSSVTTDFLPLAGFSWMSVCPRNLPLQSGTTQLFMKSLLYKWLILWWISARLCSSACKNQITALTLWESYHGWHAYTIAAWTVLEWRFWPVVGKQTNSASNRTPLESVLYYWNYM